ncbi:MAG: DUF4143 domain-containing protein [Bacilli bacterium]|nr:DUF4143 domain-containing protein [Bacilli bacterium]
MIKDLFADVYFANHYLRIDCSSDSSFTDFVFKNTDLEKVLKFISINYNIQICEETLLIFDEVQECLPIVSLLKQFCESRREIPVIATGSLVRTKIKRQTSKRGKFAKKNFLFPVGKINQLNIYPMTFDEFLMNYKPNLFQEIKDSFESGRDIGDLHQTCLSVFNEYVAIGGMPEVIDTYIDESYGKNPNALNEARSILRDIYTDYLDDMSLYQASPESVIRSKAIFENIYSQLNKESKNFKCSLIEKNSKTRDMIAPIDWLTTARVVSKSCEIKEKISVPLVSSNESLFRLYLADVGVYGLQSNLSSNEFASSLYGEFSGYFYENYLATELVARGYKLFYWKGKRDAELEFVIEMNGRLIPFDVKRNKGSLKSLDEFRNHNKKDIAVKVSSGRLGFDKDNLVLNIPFYFVPFFLDGLQKGEINESLLSDKR